MSSRSEEFRKRMDKACKELDFDIVKTLVEIAANSGNDQLTAIKILCEYGYPKLKAQEIENVEPLRVEIVDATVREKS